jgi:hypothetical protein
MLTDAEYRNAKCPTDKKQARLLIPAGCTCRSVRQAQRWFRSVVIEAQLAHAVKDANGRAYNRTQYLKHRAAMMQQWADYLDKLAAGADQVAAAGTSVRRPFGRRPTRRSRLGVGS